MKGLPKFLREQMPDIEGIHDKNTMRERKVCPKCKSMNIRYLSLTYRYRCDSCFYYFHQPEYVQIKPVDGVCK